jgi:hypothetical protein
LVIARLYQQQQQLQQHMQPRTQTQPQHHLTTLQLLLQSSTCNAFQHSWPEAGLHKLQLLPRCQRQRLPSSLHRQRRPRQISTTPSRSTRHCAAASRSSCAATACPRSSSGQQTAGSFSWWCRACLVLEAMQRCTRWS